jgi:hypothetical protein
MLMHTYWSASGRSRSLRLIAEQTAAPGERGALLDLLAVEEMRRETARRALAEVWGIKL